MGKDFYNILGIDKNANEEEIRNVYHKLVRQYHPDKNKEPESEERCKEITEAYNVLSNKLQRDSYDKNFKEKKGNNNPDKKEDQYVHEALFGLPVLSAFNFNFFLILICILAAIFIVYWFLGRKSKGAINVHPTATQQDIKA